MPSRISTAAKEGMECWLIYDGKVFNATPYMTNFSQEVAKHQEQEEQQEVDESWLIYNGKVYDAKPYMSYASISTKEKTTEINRTGDCWYISGGKVYDATPYIEAHVINLPTEMSQYTEMGDCWFIFNGNVFDANPYVDANIITLPGEQGCGSFKVVQESDSQYSLDNIYKTSDLSPQLGSCFSKNKSPEALTTCTMSSSLPNSLSPELNSRCIRRTNSQGSIVISIPVQPRGFGVRRF
eukprot:CAMPEP_0113940414 /NCGR_PEP_ID=MMETSP1339-20121228/6548_1 /TAXON_ID=94617 /ORGANISM="Fibrocapsa japonica" /LENGTH=238 /DNA_ID=CAMNT_0000944243 /DNA_START=84 /DNA_END=800 /DNA_ORIENTATION=- /assembly_acc=CAM_ASM_000762